MSLARFWSTWKLLRFSQPAGNRPLYRELKGRTVESVLEVNVGSGERSRTVVQWLRDQGNAGPLRYAAIDPFEMGEGERISLKGFHSEMGKLGVKPLPVPDTGNLAVSLKRVAHTIGAVDVLVLDCAPARFADPAVDTIMPLLLKPTTLVMGQCAEAEGLWVINACRWNEPAEKVAA